MATVKAKECFVTVNNLRLRYFDFGTEGKQPMLCLHGHAAQAHIWDEFGEAMSPYYHVYALDQRGHGGSQWATDGYQREQMVADLTALMDTLNLTKVVLVGHSMGGWSSLYYTPDHQDRVDKIILVDIAPEPSEAMIKMMATRPPTPMEFATFDEAATWARSMNPWISDERMHRDLNDRMRQMPNGKWTWKADPALFKAPLRDTSDKELIARYWRAMETITCPILLVRGLGSVLVSDEVIERMRKANPRFRAVDVADAGHVVSIDQPERFIAATSEFLGVPSQD